MGIGNLGLSELLVVAVIVLLFFGPSRLPEIGRSVGGALREFKKGMNEVKREFEEVERRARGEESGRSEDERERPSGRISPPRSIEDAPTFGSREPAAGEDRTAGREREEEPAPDTDSREGSQS